MDCQSPQLPYRYHNLGKPSPKLKLKVSCLLPRVWCAIREGREEDQRLPALRLDADVQAVKVSHPPLGDIIQVHQQCCLSLESVLFHKIGRKGILQQQRGASFGQLLVEPLATGLTAENDILKIAGLPQRWGERCPTATKS